MSEFFAFEQDFVESLRCIPMQVRLKLDTCGVKLKLTHWHEFTQEERKILVVKPCTTEAESKEYREFLQNLVVEKTGTPAGELDIDPNPAWMDSSTIPASIEEKAAEFDVTITPQQWSGLTPAQRFALIKLSRPSHENKNFLPALQEFGLS